MTGSHLALVGGIEAPENIEAPTRERDLSKIPDHQLHCLFDSAVLAEAVWVGGMNAPQSGYEGETTATIDALSAEADRCWNTMEAVVNELRRRPLAEHSSVDASDRARTGGDDTLYVAIVNVLSAIAPGRDRAATQ